ncbi:hypothetical protein A5893_01115 [Pedobacter psychrophilus]|uniref:Chemotaxis methyl-accepting receptor HlyB-like 4HB MCP domain-containing protein n=1 Tax=Pedobacter psychrophilus TaxID=1826909 RepID=A0A179DLJ5_9SPHI|nr:hypothetical protein [Pedobacter psychrophilus]OAQ41744.1 hypothetical protein A5893_01115 [Pedobacter psychrophilus]
MKYILLSIFILSSFFANAFQNVDSLTYSLQRNKINGMLQARSSKFGQFDNSLSERTGIFGFKTKKDMQRSMDILTQIIKTDNDILRETKTLLDYKTYQQEQVATQGKDYEYKNLAYMKTINKLQVENDRLVKDNLEFKKSKKFFQIVSYALGLAIISFALFVFRKISPKKS